VDNHGNPCHSSNQGQMSHEFYKKLLKLAGAGCAAFWITDFIISVSPIAAEYRAAFSISSLPLALVQALVGGLVIGCCVSYFLLRFFDKIPTKKPIVKALILSFVAMVMIEVLSTLINPSNASVYLLIDTGMNAPRFLALGIVVGHLYKRLYGSARTQIVGNGLSGYSLFKEIKNEFKQKDRKNGRVPLFHVFFNFDHCKYVWPLYIRRCPSNGQSYNRS
jgi:hypothetical protein